MFCLFRVYLIWIIGLLLLLFSCFRMDIYFVITSWIFGIGLCENSTNQSNISTTYDNSCFTRQHSAVSSRQLEIMFSMPTTRSKGSGRKPNLMENIYYVGASCEMAKVDGKDNDNTMTAASDDGGAGVSLRMCVSSIISALPSFLFGYCISALNTALVTGDTGRSEDCFSGDDNTCPKGSALRDLDLPTLKQEVATSLLIAGCFLGSMVASKPSDSLGRRATLLLNNVLFIAGGVLCAIAVNPSGLFLGRFLGGMAVGCGSGVVPVLLSEVSSSKSRGAVGSVHQLMINLGILSSGLFGYALVKDVDHGWRYIQGFIAVPAIAQLVLAKFVPESPRWLVKQGRILEAKATLRKLHQGQRAGEEDEIDREVENMDGVTDKGEDRKSIASWADIFVHRRPVMIGVVLMLIQAFTGINTVTFYSTTIFELAGVNDTVLATVSVGVTLVVMTSVTGMIVDKVGRRSLMLIGTSIMGVALGTLSLSLFTLNATPRLQGYLAVAATLTFIAGFSIGQGSTSWILLTEIVPSRIRARAFSIFTAINWGANLVVGLGTLSTIEAMGAWLHPASPEGEGEEGDDASPSSQDQQKAGVAGLYAMFSILSFISVVFVHLFVRETMGKSLEELEGVGRADRARLSYNRMETEEGGDVADALLSPEEAEGESDPEDARRVVL